MLLGPLTLFMLICEGWHIVEPHRPCAIKVWVKNTTVVNMLRGL